MASTACRQICAIVRRYWIAVLRTPIGSFLRILGWPGLILGLCTWLLINVDTNYANESDQLIVSVPILFLLLTAFNVYSFSNWFINDRASKVKSLMISMGLRRFSYHTANAICMLICLLPIAIYSATLCVVFLFKGSSSSAIFLLFILVTIHLVGFTFAIVSFITSTSYVSIVFIVIFLQTALHSLVIWVLASSHEVWHSTILFIASASPYESLQIFCDSYRSTKNANVTSMNHKLVNQPTWLILVAVTFWTLASLAFARWFEEVCPWQNDSAVKSPLFCLKSESRKESNSEEMDTLQRSKYFEVVRHNSRPGINISNVSKAFNSVLALQNVSFKIYKGETTLLLGHNGAGKSTLMNVVLGMLQPETGYISVEGQGVRPAIGVCPQESILDGELTVEQHLVLFVDIKSNLSGHERSQHIRQTLDDVSLTSHANKRPNELSGGMKRKLSLGIAFAGKSDVLILDEPSSGLDPDSRMFIWNAIRRYRTDRTVLLSTQHMEEADYLGDRIAIMSSGQIVCCGSSLFLNKLFGTGYKLRIECVASNSQQILGYIRTFFPRSRSSNSDVVSKNGVHKSETNSVKRFSSKRGDRTDANSSEAMTDFIVELQADNKSHDYESRLIKLLEDLETNGQRFGIVSFGLKSSSIEDVMLQTSKFFAHEPSESTRLNITTRDEYITRLVNVQTLPSDQGRRDFCNLYCALMKKHIQTFLGNWKTIIIFRILVPIVGAYYCVEDMNNKFTAPPEINQPSVTNLFMVFHFIYFPVLERATKFKTMQLTSNANYFTYWLAQATIDFTTVITNTIFLNLAFTMFYHQEIIASKVEIHSIITITSLLSGLAAMAFAYALSNIMNDPRKAIGYNIFIYSTGLFSYVLFFLLDMALINRVNLDIIRNGVKYLLIFLLPTEAFLHAIRGLNYKHYISNSVPADGFSPVYLGILALSFQIIAYSTVLYLIEAANLDLEWYSRPSNLLPCCFKTASIVGEQHAIDNDVVSESAKANSLIRETRHSAYSLIAADLSKSYYASVKVVEGLSFTVNKGECFGLLGINGAGKTTTFSMLTADCKPDRGRIWSNGYYSDEHIDNYRQHIGFDPQSTPELSLTPCQALSLMARLRGVDPGNIPIQVNSVLELLDMSQHAYKLTSELSGGTKRKLALGMALIGNPTLLTLDEPTAGVDPMARRGIWQLLRTLRSLNHASIIISSHAMEECEAICDRISVMARGRLRCIGTFLHLRSKFAQGCTLRVQFSRPSNLELPAGRRRSSGASSVSQIVTELKQILETNIGPSTKLSDQNVNSATFTFSDNSIQRSKLFKLMLDFTQKHPNVSYMVNDSSLEDIFISIAKEQQTNS